VIVLVPAGGASAEQLLELPPEEVHHLRVRRAEPGQPLELRDGAGLVGEAILLECTARHALVRVTASRVVEPPPPLTLLVAAGDKERFGWLVEKTGELGVTRVVPIETARTAGVASRVGAAHLTRLRRRALDAIKQSGAAWAPDVAGLAAFATAITAVDASTRWLADAAGDWPEPALASTHAAVLIGPEGGLTKSERDAAVGGGWRPTRLATAVLRFETAAVAAACCVAVARGRGTNG